MKTKDAIRRRILDLCAERKMTINKLAMVSGITQSTLNNIINSGSNNPTVATVKKLCDGLNISLEEFFAAKVFSMLEQEIS